MKGMRQVGTGDDADRSSVIVDDRQAVDLLLAKRAEMVPMVISGAPVIGGFVMISPTLRLCNCQSCSSCCSDSEWLSA